MDDRLALRLGAFRLARRRGRSRDAAWASSRLRLEGVSLEPNEARFARAMRVRFGHALRVARIRRGRPAGASVALPLLVAASGLRLRWIIAAIVGALVVLAALFFLFTSSEQGGEPEGARPAQAAIVTPPPPLRGRTEPGVTPVAVVVATPAPAEAPPASAPPAGGGTGNAGTGTGSGGSGGGNGTGNGTRTPTPTVKPTPSPTPTPAPTVASTLVHVKGRVTDFSGVGGIPGVCISYGSLDCSLASTPHTDANGSFDVVLDAGSSSEWTLRFEKAGYAPNTFRFTIPQPPPQTMFIGTFNLRPQ